jgi:C1A family cysteine protease
MSHILKHRFGWVPDLPDQRDFLVKKTVVKLPASVDLRATCAPIEDQGQLGSCTAHALTGALEFLEKKDGVTLAQLSRLFVYYNERALEGTIASDAGASLRDGIKTLITQGVCPETEWPYTISQFAVKPTDACYTDARKDLVTLYQSLTSLTDMKTCLADGYPFVFGFTVYESFESNTVAVTGIVPMPGSGESVLGGHAVLAVGYNDSTSRFLVRNSWGTSWGMSGYFTIPYAYLTNTRLANNFWKISKDAGF